MPNDTMKQLSGFVSRHRSALVNIHGIECICSLLLVSLLQQPELLLPFSRVSLPLL